MIYNVIYNVMFIVNRDDMCSYNFTDSSATVSHKLLYLLIYISIAVTAGLIFCISNSSVDLIC